MWTIPCVCFDTAFRPWKSLILVLNHTVCFVTCCPQVTLRWTRNARTVQEVHFQRRSRPELSAEITQTVGLFRSFSQAGSGTTTSAHHVLILLTEVCLSGRKHLTSKYQKCRLYWLCLCVCLCFLSYRLRRIRNTESRSAENFFSPVRQTEQTGEICPFRQWTQ